MTEQTITHSIPLDEMSLEQLVQLSQGLGRQIDKLREQRAYLKGKIAERLAAVEQLVQLSQGLGRQIDKLREQRAYLKGKIDARLAAGERTSTDANAAGDAEAPGATIDAGLQG